MNFQSRTGSLLIVWYLQPSDWDLKFFLKFHSKIENRNPDRNPESISSKSSRLVTPKIILWLAWRCHYYHRSHRSIVPDPTPTKKPTKKRPKAKKRKLKNR